jgi:hypothetical protein
MGGGATLVSLHSRWNLEDCREDFFDATSAHLVQGGAAFMEELYV